MTDLRSYNVEKQHAKKKLHACERIALLLDKDSFCEICSGVNNYTFNHATTAEPTSSVYDGVITGRGTISGKTVFVFAQDFTISGGTIGLNHGKKIGHLIQLAMKAKCPVIGIYDSGGARIGEGINALAGCGALMNKNIQASGRIPQISVVVGPCAGAAAYSPALTDFIFMVEQIGQLYVTGNKVIEQVTGESCTLQELGGAKVHAKKSGVAHFYCSSEKKCFAEVRRLVKMLPSSFEDKESYADISYVEKRSNIAEIVPADGKTPYSMPEFIEAVVDNDSFIEVHKDFSPSMVVGFAKLCGIRVGIIANNPMVNSGSIDCDASDKAARMIRFCDAFSIPVITFVDTPGYLPGISEEHNGIIRHGAKLLYAYTEATTIELTVVIRKAYGGAYIAMGSKHMGTDYVYATPYAALAVMGADGAVSIVHRKELEKLSQEEAQALRVRLIEEYNKKYMNSNIATLEGYVDEVIDFDMIRQRLFQDLKAFEKKEEPTYRKKHGNIPL